MFLDYILFSLLLPLVIGYLLFTTSITTTILPLDFGKQTYITSAL